MWQNAGEAFNAESADIFTTTFLVIAQSLLTALPILVYRASLPSTCELESLFQYLPLSGLYLGRGEVPEQELSLSGADRETGLRAHCGQDAPGQGAHRRHCPVHQLGCL